MAPGVAAVRGTWLAGLAAAMLLASAGGSCGGNAFTSGDGGGSAGNEAGPFESGSPGDAGGPVEASVSNDGALASDVVDGTIEAAGTGFCATTRPVPTFCEDFDEYTSVTGLLAAWPGFQQAGGTFQFDTTNDFSPPNALDVSGASGAQTIVVKTFPVGSLATNLRLEFELRFNSSPKVGLLSAVGIAAIAFGRTVNDGFAALGVGNGPVLSGSWAERADAGPSDAGTFKAMNATGAFPTIGAWAARYAIVIDFTSGSGCEQILQGTTPLLAQCLALPPDFAHPTEVSIVLGDYASGLNNTGMNDVEFDNVTFTIK